MSDHDASLATFGGYARLFPLPNLVFFPHVMQPLHIFEPRYRQMTADALDDDKLIALCDGLDAAAAAVRSGRLLIEGELADLELFAQLFHVPAAPEPPTGIVVR